MKNKLLLITSLFLLAMAPASLTGCKTAPTHRSTEVTTLKIVGASVDASMRLAAQLLKDGTLTWPQWQKIADFHDNTFLPAYNVAVSAVQSDLSSVASPDLVGLSAQLAALVASFIPPPK